MPQPLCERRFVLSTACCRVLGAQAASSCRTCDLCAGDAGQQPPSREAGAQRSRARAASPFPSLPEPAEPSARFSVSSVCLWLSLHPEAEAQGLWLWSCPLCPAPQPRPPSPCSPLAVMPAHLSKEMKIDSREPFLEVSAGCCAQHVLGLFSLLRIFSPRSLSFFPSLQRLLATLRLLSPSPALSSPCSLCPSSPELEG